MGFSSEAGVGRLDGLTGRSAGRRDLVRWVKRVLGASRETGGWAKAAGVGAAGGALAQSGAKRGMYSCDDLLCILSGRAEGIKLARSGANCRVNSCAALLFLQKFLRIGAACRAGGGRVMVLQPCMFCKKYTFVKVQRWFAVALDFQLWIQRIRLFRLLQGSGHKAYASKSECQICMPNLLGFLIKGRDNRWKLR